MPAKKKQTAKTKAELVEEVDRLKGLLRESKKEIERLAEKKESLAQKVKKKLSTMEEEAVGLIKAGKKFKLVVVGFNPSTMESKIKSISSADVREEDAAMALMSLKKFIIDNIYNRTINDLEGGKYESVEDFTS